MTVKELVPRTDDGQPFLPDLEELSLLGCRLEDGSIGRMVAARSNAGKPLGAFKVWFSAKEDVPSEISLPLPASSTNTMECPLGKCEATISHVGRATENPLYPVWDGPPKPAEKCK
ncbi:hypothetical protein BDN72DRAFT_861378 [Pluteus cervinus]|uniref:Uncharacterized protein n=1 Tax=Pluteus cervinus TaxID=181527 RepID=A0ACD3AG98_9AGAR|nr:hypothetical protein BDN72DRAFT_861378 [Pluteus cervinus]